MKPSICFYFQVHQPYRLRDVRIHEIGEMDADSYFDEEKNHAIFRKVAEKCYLPANALMLKLIRKHPEFRISYSLSGVFLDQCRAYGPDVLESFKKLAKTGNVEFLGETYYHSLASLSSLEEFCMQVKKHADTIERLFGVRPHVFRNTELIYSNELAHVARQLGFRGMLAEGADHVLHGHSPNKPYTPPVFRLPREKEAIIRKYRVHPTAQRSIRILLKNYRLSDDVAFRFSDKSWIGYPLHSDTFTHWLSDSGGHSVNLFMDYETFGEHQWADTGIFSFVEALPMEWKKAGLKTATPSQVIASWGKKPCDTLDVHNPMSWADMERDLSAWRGNSLQEAMFKRLYDLEKLIHIVEDPILTETWRKLQTSDHFYYLCTKYWSDGDVHKYFSPYDSPYEAYRRLSHVMEDLRMKLTDKSETIKIPVAMEHDESNKKTEGRNQKTELRKLKTNQPKTKNQ